MSNQKYTTEFKKKVVEFYLDHHTVKETLQEFHIPESTLFAWKHQYQTRMFEKPRSTKSDSIKHMQRKLDRMKAVCILLTLLHLGIKNILLGPSLPAFVSPNVLSFLVEKFNITPISTPKEDMKRLLG